MPQRLRYTKDNMPRLAASHSQLPQLSDDITCEEALHLECALQEMHAVSLLHIDVNRDSVVWNTADMWHSAD